MRFTLACGTLLVMMSALSSAQPIDKRESGVDKVVHTITGLFKGSATFFHPVSEGGPIGSCGPKENDNSPICALNLHQYGDEDSKSHWCGKKVLIKHKNKQTTCTITDCCPGCGPNSLDLTPRVFSQLAEYDIGVIPITWCIIGTKGCSK
ncbi:RlpA-like double-psi beta-barrel-protein domain-containing protein-containing protein [Radiomyces spectabilis]|uniref:RlpA-like double-psi beta-barrel-protein domain-containing protein-containing protein n=1 Tax=Radiomyces spectabilis TaxID=64574 RepID=UPI00221F3FB5|nr:RlpA-like double-psi beta-barrel-protein domain-containing protein-containing protein [Radiomyces spectabilis]KAI8379065.1 RlpA-like double-psi beta-barrel-protein domain-containing protein-containing protein [Radiomyces spectabilis]